MTLNSCNIEPSLIIGDIDYQEFKQALKVSSYKSQLNSNNVNNLDNLLKKFDQSEFNKLINEQRKANNLVKGNSVNYIGVYVEDGEVVKYTLTIISVMEDVSYISDLYKEPQDKTSYFHYKVSSDELNAGIRDILNEGKQKSKVLGFFSFKKEGIVNLNLLYEPLF